MVRSTRMTIACVRPPHLASSYPIMQRGCEALALLGGGNGLIDGVQLYRYALGISMKKALDGRDDVSAGEPRASLTWPAKHRHSCLKLSTNSNREPNGDTRRRRLIRTMHSLVEARLFLCYIF